MIDNERKRQRALEYIKTHTLSPEQRRKMIWDKLERGIVYAKANKSEKTL